MNIQTKQRTKGLVIGSGSIYITFCIAAVLQEYIIQRTYFNWRSGIHEKMKYANAFVIIPALVGWIFGMAANVDHIVKNIVPAKNMFYCGLLIVLSNLSYTQAIYYSNFPIVMMFKSCHILSVVVVSLFCSRVKQKSQKLSKKQVFSGCIVLVGLLMYNLGGSKEHLLLSFHPIAVGLLLFSLVCDGFLPDFQAEIKTVYKPTALEMFQQINKWTFYISVGFSFAMFELIDMIIFFIEHPLSFLDIVTLSTLSGFGQIAVFKLITKFRQHVVPFIITTRKILTTVISIIVFKHQLYVVQFLGIITIFWAVILDFYHELTRNSNIIQQNDVIQPQKSEKNKQDALKQLSNNQQDVRQRQSSIIKQQNLIQLQVQNQLEPITNKDINLLIEP